MWFLKTKIGSCKYVNCFVTCLCLAFHFTHVRYMFLAYTCHKHFVATSRAKRPCFFPVMPAEVAHGMCATAPLTVQAGDPRVSPDLAFSGPQLVNLLANSLCLIFLHETFWTNCPLSILISWWSLWASPSLPLGRLWHGFTGFLIFVDCSLSDFPRVNLMSWPPRYPSSRLSVVALERPHFDSSVILIVLDIMRSFQLSHQGMIFFSFFRVRVSLRLPGWSTVVRP